MNTITITINIATTDMFEGNSEFKLTVSDNDLRQLDRNQLASELDDLLDDALMDYDWKNSNCLC